nr:DNA/RNA non-specific endonuclease [Clostridia bacterium]
MRMKIGLLALLLTLAVILTACSTGGRDCEHIYDNACDTDCNECGESREVGEHTDADGNGKCDECGIEVEAPACQHTYDNACDTDCNKCGESREVGEHTYDNACDTDCNECGESREVGGHTDTDRNAECDKCGAELPKDIPAVNLVLPELPAYTTENYEALNGNKPYFTLSEITDESYEHYSSLDSLGRCGTAVACLGPDLLPTGNRGSVSSVSPSGWQDKSIYERCHLIAWSLAGEDANKQNLITGTYTLNEVMQEYEDMICDYIKETGNHVMYRVTPVYDGDNLVAKGVIMEAMSVEDEGAEKCFCIYIHNVQKDYEIDYATGVATVKAGSNMENCTFIINKNSHIIHLPTCSSAKGTKEENKIYSYKSLEETLADLKEEYPGVTSWNYCSKCHPENSN